jgi:DNA polymerase-3 subunit alpha
MRELLKRLSPNNFEDIIAILSLYRPGPIQAGATEEYVRRKKGKSPVLYPHPSMEGILKETYGLIVYQEQVMRMAAELAGFSMAKADMLRKAMGKKKEELMSSDLMGDFIKGMVEKGIPEEIARDIAQKIHSFAQYAFNKSHSTGYALLSYITAYLKAHFREEFYTAILNSEIDKIEKLSFFLQQARREGIEILPPCIINSEPFFKVEKDGKIRYGLLGIKNVGKQAVLNIVDIRSNKRFSSFEDFLRRVDSRKVNKKVIEALIKAGAFDVFGKSRAELFSMLERRSGVRMQGMLFGELNKEKSSEFSQREEDIKKIMKWEKEVLNTYLTKHPLEPFELYVKILSSHTSKDIQELSSERERGEVRMCGILSKIERRIFEGENKKSYFILHLEDFEGEFQGILFEEVFKKVERFLEKDEVYYLEGELSPSSTRIICNDIMPLKHAINLKIKKVVLNINVDELTEKRVEKLKELLAENSGTIELWFRIKINSKKKLYKSNDFKISLSEGLVKKIEEIFGENKMEVLL